MPKVEFSLILNAGESYIKAHFTDSQVLTTLQHAESGVSNPELCREHGMGNYGCL